MQKVIILKGLPGSGKSTWAFALLVKHPGVYKRINKDLLRTMLDGGKWSKSNEKFVVLLRDKIIVEALADNRWVIIDDTNLDPRHERRIRELVETYNTLNAPYKAPATVEIKDFTDVPLEECIKRDQNRSNYVGEKVIRRMWRQYLMPKVEALVYDIHLPDAVLCDLDGTLALLNGRNPYDASTCEQDVLNDAVYHVLGSVAAIANDEIILVSGRMDKYRIQTENWLHGHDIPYDQLFMRPTDDMRKDAVVKQEIYEREIKGRYNVRFVLDDRNQCIELWRSLGLTALQVAPGDF